MSQPHKVYNRCANSGTSLIEFGAAQTNTALIAAPATGNALYIDHIVVTNGATAGKVTLLDGSGGAVKFSAYLPINGSVVVGQPASGDGGYLFECTDATGLYLTSTTVTTHTVMVYGFISRS